MKINNVGEKASILLALLTIAGLIAWTLVTHYRVDVNAGFMPPPGHWATAAIPVGAALVVLGLQAMFLGWALVSSTSDQAAGIRDEFISYATFATPAIILLLVAVGVVRSGPNHILGLVAFLFGNFSEMVLTKCGWTVANRRPGGVIGGAVPSA